MGTLSIVIPVLNSHEIVRRQLLHWQRCGFGDMPDLQMILVDDGSDPPITSGPCNLLNLHILYTHDTRPWTQPKARNIGARAAVGDFLLLTDIDHIIPRKAVEWGLRFPYDFGRFRREFGVLDEQGVFTQDVDVLAQYGFPRERVATRGLRAPCHTLSMVIRRSLFEDIGGFPEDRKGYPTHDDGFLKGRLSRKVRAGEITQCPDDPGNDQRETIYMFPNGQFCGSRNYNPFGLFHNLPRTREVPSV